MSGSRRNTSKRPLVLLDVDGVINDLGCLYGQPRPWGISRIPSNGFVVHIPDYMPALIRAIDATADIHWCTTWRHRANDEIAQHLGVGPFPVVDDGTQVRNTGWKSAAAHDLAAEALRLGRRVIWIEDFYGAIPAAEMPPGVEFIDTAAVSDDAVLRPSMIPESLAPSEAA